MNDNNEKPINEVLIADNAKRKIIPVEGSRWGELIIPARNENPDKTDKGFRVLAITSFLLGYLLFETLKECEKRYPNRLNIVGLVTDDPANPYSKISIKRRIWRLFGRKEKVELEREMIESALTFGVPCYTGEVKSEYFRKLLKHWKPDAILVCVFGQIVDKPIIDYPKYGIYNFHPADLAHHHGAGPRPYEDLINRKATTSKVTIHQITEDVDAGHILCQSPLINVKLQDGKLTDKILVLDDKMMKPIDQLGAKLISELILKKETGKEGKIDKLDVKNYFSDKYKNELLQPIKSNNPNNVLPVIDKDLKFFT
jgi:folate-dependent phosphoribosylglycinamide formyltransferase PurN